MYYIQVSIPLYIFGEFTYKSEKKIEPGCRIYVNFNNQRIQGLVIQCTEIYTGIYPETKIKFVESIIDTKPYLNDDAFELIKFAANYLHTPLGMIVPLAQPALLRKGSEAKRSPIYYYEIANHNFCPQNTSQSKILSILSNGMIPESEIKIFQISPISLKTLIKKNVINKVDINERNKDIYENLEFKNKKILNNEQSKALLEINSTEGFDVFLLYGVTGSGKTEVYMQAMEKILKRKQQILVLVPEIGLTPQTIERFHNRFNVPIAAMHSALSDKERLDNYIACRDGKIAILIGTRSSVFTPFKSLGMIIVDEEHDSSYKQQDNCRYNGKNIAIYKAKIANCPIVLGSATPTLESIHNAQKGKYKLINLHNKAFENHGTTSHRIIDIRNSNLNAGISDQLLSAINAELSKGNQVLIFLNRRGYASKLICNDCGHVLTCLHCDSFLTYHKSKNCLNCHHCETNYAVPNKCPKCSSTKISAMGNGTEKIEEFLTQQFPNSPIIRIDRDTTQNRQKFEQALNDIKSLKYRILIGTQILSKGHHFPHVTLIGLLNIDQYLYSNDFRSTEHLAQLYTQIAGRTGREEKNGMVFIQSYSPNNLILHTIIDEGYSNFANFCLEERKYLNLPPYSYQAIIRISSKDKKTLTNKTSEIFQILACYSKKFDISLESPRVAMMEKKQNKYRMLILFSSNSRKKLSNYLNCVTEEMKKFKINSEVEYYIDMDPSDILQ